jgi:hypothetical protein
VRGSSLNSSRISGAQRKPTETKIFLIQRRWRRANTVLGALTAPSTHAKAKAKPASVHCRRHACQVAYANRMKQPHRSVTHATRIAPASSAKGGSCDASAVMVLTLRCLNAEALTSRE